MVHEDGQRGEEVALVHVEVETEALARLLQNNVCNVKSESARLSVCVLRVWRGERSAWDIAQAKRATATVQWAMEPTPF